MKVKVSRAKLPKFIKRIIILNAGTQPLAAAADRVKLLPKRRRKRRSKGLLRIWERLVLRRAKARAAAAQDYQARHENSNRKHRNGWLRDLSYNRIRAARKGAKVGQRAQPVRRAALASGVVRRLLWRVLRRRIGR